MLESPMKSGIFAPVAAGNLANPDHWLHLQMVVLKVVVKDRAPTASRNCQQNWPASTTRAYPCRHVQRTLTLAVRSALDCESTMKQRYRLYRRGRVYYSQDNQSGK